MNTAVKPQKIWDIPVRLFHWTLVLLILLLWITGEFGGVDLTFSLPGKGDVYLSNMDIHALAGQGIFVLVIFRFLWGIWGSTTARFSHFIKKPSAVFAEIACLVKGRLTGHVGHNPLGGLMIAVLLLLLAAQSVTGMFSADDLFYEGPLTHLVSDDAIETASGLHHRLFSILQVLVIIHILAVFYYLIRGHNLIGAMFTGRKKMPQAEPLTFSPWWLAIISLLLPVGLLLFLRSL